jgi:hypothetical protein
MTVGELGERMSAREFAAWQDFYQRNPFGSWRDNFHAAMMCSLTYNINSKSNKNLDEFFFRTKEEASKQSTENTLNSLMAMAKTDG